MNIPRIGHGYDVHRLTEGRALVLGGVTVPWEKGLLGHSDADVLLHALMDALLGAAALGDIGHLGAVAGKPQALLGGGLDADRVHRQIQVGGNIPAHLFKIRSDLRPLSDQGSPGLAMATMSIG